MLEWSKWGMNQSTTFGKEEIPLDEIIILAAEKSARLLKSEESFIQIQGEFLPKSSSEYFYDQDGLLLRKDYYQKLPEYQDLKLMLIISYSWSIDASLEKIEVNNPDHTYSKSVLYTWSGRNIQSIISYSSGISADFQYDPDNRDLIRVNYSLDNGGYFNYGYRYRFGNKIEEIPYGGSTSNSSHGTFEYDDNINPHHLWGITDEFLRYSSKNNEIRAEYTYSGGFPSFVPDTYNYTYDEEGYPVELIKTYKHYRTGEFGFREKIIYHY
ncbi:MAG TPA: hypothetical protein VI583_04975 [Cyclobacteriaceae bacterium]|nr:hypothetical protein [Cyclobacteriaceae bacterium]